jgi:hypothetical protein
MARGAVAQSPNGSEPVPAESHLGGKEPLTSRKMLAGCILSTSCDSTSWIPIQEDAGIY